MKAFIVDDSRLARSELRNLLRARPDTEVVGEAGDAASARAGLAQSQPDVLLLDIHMPGEDGFALLESLEHVPAVIFVTAYDAHALRAFEVNALDYLMKPVAPERLHQALDKVQRASTEPAQAPRSRSDHVFVRDGERCWLVRVSEVRLIEVMGNYSRLMVGPDRPIVQRPLRHFEERLDPRVFVRANRSQIINLDWVQAVAPGVGDGFIVTLRDGTEVEVSRRQARELRERLEI